MPRPRKQRTPSCPITQSDYDGQWHGYLTVGRKPNGKPDIRHRSGPTREACAAKILKLEDEIAAKGAAPEVGRSMLLKEFLAHWYAEGTRPRKQRDGTTRARWKYSTARDYRLVINDYIVPNAGDWRLDEFTASTRHGKSMIAAVAETVSDSAARKAHLVLRSALSDAEEDDLVDRNVMKAISPPTVVEAEEEWLTVEEGKRILAAIARRPRLRSRWLLAMALGQRQGECLGLRWTRPELRGAVGDVNLDTGELTIRKKLERRAWEHGCDDPVACVRNRVDGNGRPYNICKANPCGRKYAHGCGDQPCGKPQVQHCPQRELQPGCWRHRTKDGGPKECPPPCRPDCAGHASTCPKRAAGGLVDDDPKTRAGHRTAQMPRPLWDAFRERKSEQDRERAEAGRLWVETGYVHTTDIGTPLDPKRDSDDWHALLAEAGVDAIKLHAARHYAVTILILLGVPVPVIMHILGWSTDMTKRYGHIVSEMVREVAGRLETFHWGEAEQVLAPPPASPFRPAPGQRNTRGSSTDHSTGNVIKFRPRAV